MIPPPPLGKSPRPLRMIFPLESRWDLSEWVLPWEVPHTSQNDFPLGKALRPLGMSFPLGSPPDLSEWFSPWEVPQTPQNDFPPGKSPRPLRIKKVMPLSTTNPSPPQIHEHFSILRIPAYMTFFSFIFKFSRDLCQTAGGSAGLSLRSRDQGFPPATTNVAPGYFQGKIKEKKTKEILSCLIPRLLVEFTQQLEILATALFRNHHLY